MNVILTEHAIERAWQRLGWTAGSLERMIERVITFGLSEADTSGALRRYLIERCDAFRGHRSRFGPGAKTPAGRFARGRDGDTHVRTYGEHLFVFRSGGTDFYLVTVWQLPRELRPALRRAFAHAEAA